MFDHGAAGFQVETMVFGDTGDGVAVQQSALHAAPEMTMARSEGPRRSSGCVYRENWRRDRVDAETHHIIFALCDIPPRMSREFVQISANTEFIPSFNDLPVFRAGYSANMGIFQLQPRARTIDHAGRLVGGHLAAPAGRAAVT
ncbi:MAG: hypothetical protein ACREEE_14685, partial [Dongiaceae bacterium]